MAGSGCAGATTTLKTITSYVFLKLIHYILKLSLYNINLPDLGITLGVNKNPIITYIVGA